MDFQYYKTSDPRYLAIEEAFQAENGEWVKVVQAELGTGTKILCQGRRIVALGEKIPHFEDNAYRVSRKGSRTNLAFVPDKRTKEGKRFAGVLVRINKSRPQSFASRVAELLREDTKDKFIPIVQENAWHCEDKAHWPESWNDNNHVYFFWAGLGGETHVYIRVPLSERSARCHPIPDGFEAVTTVEVYRVFKHPDPKD